MTILASQRVWVKWLMVMTIVAFVSVASRADTDDDQMDMEAMLAAIKVRQLDLWTCLPDPLVDAPVGVDWALWSDDDEKRVMSKLGIPFLLDAGDSMMVASITATVFFIAEPGFCVSLSSFGYQRMLFMFYPELHAYLFSLSRLEELRQAFHYPREHWEVMLNGKFSTKPSVRQAEQHIMRLNKREVEGPALLPISMFSMNFLNLSFVDFSISGQPEAALDIDVSSFLRRQAEHQRLRQKFNYQVKVEAYNQLLLSSAEESKKVYRDAVAAYRVTEEKRAHTRDNLKKLFESLKEKENLRPDTTQHPKALDGNLVHCTNLAHALNTLQTQEAISLKEPRYAILVELHQRHQCTFQLPTLSNEGTPASKTVGAIDLCEHVEQFLHWKESHGYSHSPAQSVAFLLSMYVMHADLQSDEEATVDQLLAAVSPFDPHEFIIRVLALVRQGKHHSCGEQRKESFPESGELWYLLASAELLRVVKRDECQRALGVLHLHQAMWFGSRGATSFLATLRELGMFTTQHEKAAAHLLTRSLTLAQNDIILQLLERYSVFPWHHSSPQSSGPIKAIPLSHLLRYERFFGWRGDAWNDVDRPYVNLGRLKNLLSLDDQDDDEAASEESDDDGEWTTDEYRFLKAAVWTSGLQGIKLDTQRAKCELFTVLRRHSFGCDLSPSIYGVNLSRDWLDSCPNVMDEFRGSMSLCYGDRKPFTKPKPLDLDVSEYDALQEALYKLSFTYLLEQQFAHSSFYAMMSMKLAYDAHTTGFEMGVEQAERKKGHPRSDEKAKRRRDNREDEAAGKSTVSFFQSDMFTYQPLMIAALSRVLSLSQQNTSQVVGAVTDTIFSLLGLNSGSGDVGGGLPFAQALVLLLGSAAEEEQEDALRDYEKNNLSQINSITALVWLMKHLHSSGDTPLSVQSFSRFHSSQPPILYQNVTSLWIPQSSDTWETFACRLSQQAVNVHGFSAHVMKEQLRLVCDPPDPASRQIVGSPKRLDRMPSIHALHWLRMEKQWEVRAATSSPLRHVSDVSHYLSGSGQTFMSKAFTFLTDALSYLFTETTAEFAVRELAEAVLPANTSRLETVATSRDILTAFFKRSPTFRHFMNAVLLFSSAVEIGTAQGFALIFYAAKESSNPYLRDISTFMARDHWGPLSVAMWREMHYVSQWHLEKPKAMESYSHLFTLDHHTPFQGSSSEARLELMGRMGLWMAQMFSTKEEEQRRLSKRQLMLCSGYLNYLHYVDQLKEEHSYAYSPHSPFTGSVLSAAYIPCLAELVEGDAPLLTLDEVGLYGSQLAELTQRHMFFYKLRSKMVIDTTAVSSSSPAAVWEDRPPLRQAEIKPYFLVEPWALSDGDWYPLHTGEGRFFNGRLHQLTGASWVAWVTQLRAKVFRYITSLVSRT